VQGIPGPPPKNFHVPLGVFAPAGPELTLYVLIEDPATLFPTVTFIGDGPVSPAKA
jgi:hypothetical protein